MSSSDKQIILEKLIMKLPRLLEISHSGMFTKSDGAYVKCEKFKTKGYGDFAFYIKVINMNLFANREEFDEAVMPTYLRDGMPSSSKIEAISIEEAIGLFVNIECNMSYYLSNRDEIEKDLKRQISEAELSTPMIEKELFLNLMCKIFKSERKDQDENSFMLKEFHVITNDGNYEVATAIRDESYVILTHSTS